MDAALEASVRLDVEPEAALQELQDLVPAPFQLTRDVVLGVRSQLRAERADVIGSDTKLS